MHLSTTDTLQGNSTTPERKWENPHDSSFVVSFVSYQEKWKKYIRFYQSSVETYLPKLSITCQHALRFEYRLLNPPEVRVTRRHTFTVTLNRGSMTPSITELFARYFFCRAFCISNHHFGLILLFPSFSYLIHMSLPLNLCSFHDSISMVAG